MVKNQKLENAIDKLVHKEVQTAKVHKDDKPVKQKSPKKMGDTVKATYYINKGLYKKFKNVAADMDREQSDLVNEAITDLVNKYNQ